jgi:hypothetical protein
MNSTTLNIIVKISGRENSDESLYGDFDHPSDEIASEDQQPQDLDKKVDQSGQFKASGEFHEMQTALNCHQAERPNEESGFIYEFNGGQQNKMFTNYGHPSVRLMDSKQLPQLFSAPQDMDDMDSNQLFD